MTNESSAGSFSGRIAEHVPVTPPDVQETPTSGPHPAPTAFVAGSTHFRVSEQVPPIQSASDEHLFFRTGPLVHSPNSVPVAVENILNRQPPPVVGQPVATGMEGAMQLAGGRQTSSAMLFIAWACGAGKGVLAVSVFVTSSSHVVVPPGTTSWTGMQVEQSLAARQSVTVAHGRRPASGPPTQTPAVGGTTATPEQSAAVVHTLPRTHSWQSELLVHDAPDAGPPGGGAVHTPPTQISWGQARSDPHGVVGAVVQFPAQRLMLVQDF